MRHQIIMHTTNDDSWLSRCWNCKISGGRRYFCNAPHPCSRATNGFSYCLFISLSHLQFSVTLTCSDYQFHQIRASSFDIQECKHACCIAMLTRFLMRSLWLIGFNEASKELTIGTTNDVTADSLPGLYLLATAAK